ncbi:unnamed protein product [Dimorphilus gyrociliatus]|uniref:Uncharacterized protein n=1 Tax=Dimorphilus gyrociliatus TaxID=2664684 RepID=A0A7I8VW60_9ANNE|nr:unnamed protein product [Dimorphilus gyrociliatus]
MGNKQSSNRSNKETVTAKVETKENEPIEQPPVNLVREDIEKPKKSILAKTPNNTENIDQRLAEIKKKRLQSKLPKDKHINNLKTTSMESSVTKLPVTLKVVGTNTERDQTSSHQNNTSSNHFYNGYENDSKMYKNDTNTENTPKKFNLRIENDTRDEIDSPLQVNEVPKNTKSDLENKIIDQEESDESIPTSTDNDEVIESDTVKPRVLDQTEDQCLSDKSSLASERSDLSSLNEEDVARELEELIRENDFEESPRPPKRKKKLAAQQHKNDDMLSNDETFQQFQY